MNSTVLTLLASLGPQKGTTTKRAVPGGQISPDFLNCMRDSILALNAGSGRCPATSIGIALGMPVVTGLSPMPGDLGGANGPMERQVCVDGRGFFPTIRRNHPVAAAAALHTAVQEAPVSPAAAETALGAFLAKGAEKKDGAKIHSDGAALAPSRSQDALAVEKSGTGQRILNPFGKGDFRISRNPKVQGTAQSSFGFPDSPGMPATTIAATPKGYLTVEHGAAKGRLAEEQKAAGFDPQGAPERGLRTSSFRPGARLATKGEATEGPAIANSGQNPVSSKLHSPAAGNRFASSREDNDTGPDPNLLFGRRPSNADLPASVAAAVPPVLARDTRKSGMGSGEQLSVRSVLQAEASPFAEGPSDFPALSGGLSGDDGAKPRPQTTPVRPAAVTTRAGNTGMATGEAQAEGKMTVPVDPLEARSKSAGNGPLKRTPGPSAPDRVPAVEPRRPETPQTAPDVDLEERSPRNPMAQAAPAADLGERSPRNPMAQAAPAMDLKGKSPLNPMARPAEPRLSSRAAFDATAQAVPTTKGKAAAKVEARPVPAMEAPVKDRAAVELPSDDIHGEQARSMTRNGTGAVVSREKGSPIASAGASTRDRFQGADAPWKADTAEGDTGKGVAAGVREKTMPAAAAGSQEDETSRGSDMAPTKTAGRRPPEDGVKAKSAPLSRKLSGRFSNGGPGQSEEARGRDVAVTPRRATFEGSGVPKMPPAADTATPGRPPQGVPATTTTAISENNLQTADSTFAASSGRARAALQAAPAVSRDFPGAAAVPGDASLPTTASASSPESAIVAAAGGNDASVPGSGRNSERRGAGSVKEQRHRWQGAGEKAQPAGFSKTTMGSAQGPAAPVESANRPGAVALSVNEPTEPAEKVRPKTDGLRVAAAPEGAKNVKNKGGVAPAAVSHTAPSNVSGTTGLDAATARHALPAYVADQAARQIGRALQRGERTLRLNLKPPEMGAVRVDIEARDNGLRIELVTEKPATRELLLSNLHELRDALADQGVKAEKIDIQMSFDFDRSLADTGTPSNRQGNHGFRQPSPQQQQQAEKENAETPQPWQQRPSSRNGLDLMA